MNFTIILITLFALLVAWETFRAICFRSQFALHARYHKQTDWESKRYFMQANPWCYLTLTMDVLGYVGIAAALFNPHIWLCGALVLAMAIYPKKHIHIGIYLVDVVLSIVIYSLCVYNLIVTL